MEVPQRDVVSGVSQRRVAVDQQRQHPPKRASDPVHQPDVTPQYHEHASQRLRLRIVEQRLLDLREGVIQGVEYQK